MTSRFSSAGSIPQLRLSPDAILDLMAQVVSQAWNFDRSLSLVQLVCKYSHEWIALVCWQFRVKERNTTKSHVRLMTRWGSGRRSLLHSPALQNC